MWCTRSKSITNKSLDSCVTMRNTTRRWEISQSGGMSGWNTGIGCSPDISKTTFYTDYWGNHYNLTVSKQHLLSRIVGLFLWRIFLNFPLKSLGGNGSKGKLAMRPRAISSSPSEQSVSLLAISLTTLSPKDMLDGRKPNTTSFILLKESFEGMPGFPLFL